MVGGRALHVGTPATEAKLHNAASVGRRREVTLYCLS
jgi:hypothetical protein